MSENKGDNKEGAAREEISVRKPSLVRRILREGWEIAKVLIVSVIIVLPIRYFVAQPFIVRGASMEHTFEDREYLIVDELSYYLLSAPARGEVIVFHYPKDPRQFFIKRIIGLPGERIEIKKGKVTIYNKSFPAGFVLDEPYLTPPNRPTYPDSMVTIPDSMYFVLGDNRDYSSDSRIWGTLERNLIVGKVFFRAWPFERLGVFKDKS